MTGPEAVRGTPWRKSSYSALEDCVAVRRLDNGAVGIRNTKDPTETVLVITAEDMADWLVQIKAGAFDDIF